MFGALLACAAACGRPAERAPAAPASPAAGSAASASDGAAAPARVPVLDTAAVLDTLSHFIARERLTTLPRECYVLQDWPDDPPYSFAVREKHDSTCGGDPNTSPRMFNIRWDPAAGRVITDARGLAEGRVDTLPGPRLAPPR